MKPGALEFGTAESVSLKGKKKKNLYSHAGEKNYFWASASVSIQGGEDVSEIVRFNLKLNKNVRDQGALIR